MEDKTEGGGARTKIKEVRKIFVGVGVVAGVVGVFWSRWSSRSG